MMSLRILELHRVLKPTGSFYLHCDPTMSHYLKTVCDVIFDDKNFRNEIIWKRKTGKGETNQKSNRFGVSTDILLFYGKTKLAGLNPQFTFDAQGYQEYVDKFFNLIDSNGRKYAIDNLASPSPRPNLRYSYKGYEPPENGWAISKEKMEEWDKEGKLHFPEDKNGRIRRKRFLDELQGKPVQNLWDDVKPIASQSNEGLGYPTQKPKALLERILKASSNEGDTVLDGFCGCGTTIDAAESLHRNWIGIDISPIAISLIKRRLKDTYGEHLNKFEVRGTPTDEQSAIALWKQNPNAFQDWWLTEFEVFSTTFGTKGADKGIDGIAQYLTTPHNPPFTKGGKQKGGSTFAAEEGVIRAAFSVKGGVNIQSKDIDALLGAMDKHKCELGVFLTIAEPTKPMLDTIAGAGFVEIPGFKIPRLQILTLKDYFKNKKLKLPSVNITFKAAQLKGKNKQNQIKMEM